MVKKKGLVKIGREKRTIEGREGGGGEVRGQRREASGTLVASSLRAMKGL